MPFLVQRAPYVPAFVRLARIASVSRTSSTSVGEVTIKTPTLATLNDILVYIDKLDPFIEAMDEDVDVVDQDIEKSLSKPVADMKLWKKRDTLVKTWLGWPGDNADDPKNPGYYQAWQDLKKEVRGGGTLRRVWPWLIFGPLAGVLLVPAVLASEMPAAERRARLWNNVREAHLRLAEIRKELVAAGYKPSGGPLPDTPGDVGLGGLGPLGETKGKDEAKSWWESVPWFWIAVGIVLIGGAMFLGQARAFLPAPAK